MHPPSETLATTPGALFLRWHNVLITCWHGAIGRAELGAMKGSLDRVTRLYPHANAHLAIIPPQTTKITLLNADERKQVGEIFAALEHEAVGMAVVIEAPGFVAATARSMLTGMGFLLRRPYPSRTFERRADAASWLLPLAEKAGKTALPYAGLASYLEQALPRA